MVNIDDLFAITESLAKAKIIQSNMRYKLHKLTNPKLSSISEADSMGTEIVDLFDKGEDDSINLFPVNMRETHEVWKPDGRITNLLYKYVKF